MNRAARAVVEQQPADQRLADAGDQLDRLHRHQRADDAGDGAEHADHFAAGRSASSGVVPDRGRRNVRAARHEHRDLPIEHRDGARDQRLARRLARLRRRSGGWRNCRCRRCTMS